MPKRRDLYQKYEGLSPIYQRWLTNHLPMLYTVLMECNVEEHLIEEALDSYKVDRDLYELTDPTYPTNEDEQTYINQTGQYLAKIHQYGADVVIGEYLGEKLYSLPSGLYHGLIRLAYAKRSKHDLLIAQGLAYYDTVAHHLKLHAKQVKKTELEECGQALDRVLEEQSIVLPQSGTTVKYMFLLDIPEIQDRLFVLDTISYTPEVWLKYLLQRYIKTGGFFLLHTITGFHAYLMVEELIPDPEVALAQWMISSEVTMLLDTPGTPIVVDNLYTWDDIIANIHLVGDDHRMKLLFSLYELDKRYGMDECLIIASWLYKGE